MAKKNTKHFLRKVRHHPLRVYIDAKTQKMFVILPDKTRKFIEKGEPRPMFRKEVKRSVRKPEMQMHENPPFQQIVMQREILQNVKQQLADKYIHDENVIHAHIDKYRKKIQATDDQNLIKKYQSKIGDLQQNLLQKQQQRQGLMMQGFDMLKNLNMKFAPSSISQSIIDSMKNLEQQVGQQRAYQQKQAIFIHKNLQKTLNDLQTKREELVGKKGALVTKQRKNLDTQIIAIKKKIQENNDIIDIDLPQEEKAKIREEYKREFNISLNPTEQPPGLRSEEQEQQLDVTQIEENKDQDQDEQFGNGLYILERGGQYMVHSTSVRKFANILRSHMPELYGIQFIDDDDNAITYSQHKIIVFLKDHHYTVACYQKDRHEIAYFDPLADQKRFRRDRQQLLPFAVEIDESLQIPIKHNTNRVQRGDVDDASMCAHYCYMFLHRYIINDMDYAHASDFHQNS